MSVAGRAGGPWGARTRMPLRRTIPNRKPLYVRKARMLISDHGLADDGSPWPPLEIVVYWSDDDGAYLAEVPELPGCLSDGEAHAEAAANAEDAMRAWIETAREMGREVPVPKGRRLHVA